MKLTSVLSACLLSLTVTSASLGSTIQSYDATAQTFTLSTAVTSKLDVACCEEKGSFQGTFTIQFFGLNEIYDPTKPLFLTIPVIQTVTGYVPYLDIGMVCLDGVADLYSVSGNGNCLRSNSGTGYSYTPRTLQQNFIITQNLITTPFGWTFSLTTDVFAESQFSVNGGYNTAATGTEVVDFADLTLKAPGGNSLLSQGVTFQVTQGTPEPSSWALAGVGLALLALGAKRVVSR